MKDYRQFLNESVSKAFNIAIDTEEDLDKVILPIDKQIVRELISFIKGMGFQDIPLVTNSQGEIKIRAEQIKPEITQWFKDNDYYHLLNLSKKQIKDKPFRYGQGSIGKAGNKISPSTQELMVASLVLMGRQYGNLSLQEANEVIGLAKENFSNIIGVSGKESLLNQYDKNYNDLATAISSANSILDVVNPMAVYWTGNSWDDRIAKFNPPVDNIKDYNSSDIVVEDISGKFYGISLKKKARTNHVDPTLINKPITGKDSLLKNMLSDQFVQQLENEKNLFFDKVITKHYNLKNGELQKLSDEEKYDKISFIDNKSMGKYLKSPNNNFFKFIGQNLPTYTDEFVVKFMNLLFRTDLSDMVDSNEFEFFLSTGIGRFDGSTVIVEKSETKNLSSIIETLSGIFNSNLEMKKTAGKLNAWEEGTNAAKVFFTIYSNSMPIVDIEIRYKGSYTANPQFQAVATANFKNLFKR